MTPLHKEASFPFLRTFLPVAALTLLHCVTMNFAKTQIVASPFPPPLPLPPSGEPICFQQLNYQAQVNSSRIYINLEFSSPVSTLVPYSHVHTRKTSSLMGTPLSCNHANHCTLKTHPLPNCLLHNQYHRLRENHMKILDLDSFLLFLMELVYPDPSVILFTSEMVQQPLGAPT